MVPRHGRKPGPTPSPHAGSKPGPWSLVPLRVLVPIAGSKPGPWSLAPGPGGSRCELPAIPPALFVAANPLRNVAPSGPWPLAPGPGGSRYELPPWPLAPGPSGSSSSLGAAASSLS